MRKGIMALGVSILFLGVVLLGFSRMAIQLVPEFPIVAEVRAPDQTTTSLSLQGNLTSGDKFLIRFDPVPAPSHGQISWDTEVLINLTDPSGNTISYNIPLEILQGAWNPVERLPEGVANETGTYTVKAQSIFWVYLRSLTLKKVVERPPEYPYSNWFPAGIAIVVGGTGASIWGTKSSKPKKHRIKKSSRRRES